MYLIQNITIKEAYGLLHSPEKHFLTLNKPQKIYHYPSTEFKKFKDHYLPFDNRVVLYLTYKFKSTFTQGYFVPRLVENEPVALEKRTI